MMRVQAQSHYREVDSPTAMAEHEVMRAKLEGFLNPQTAIVKYGEKDRTSTFALVKGPKADRTYFRVTTRR